MRTRWASSLWWLRFLGVCVQCLAAVFRMCGHTSAFLGPPGPVCCAVAAPAPGSPRRNLQAACGRGGIALSSKCTEVRRRRPQAAVVATESGRIVCGRAGPGSTVVPVKGFGKAILYVSLPVRVCLCLCLFAC